LVDFFKRLADNARIAKLEISQIKELSDAEAKRQQISADITRLQNQKKVATSRDTKGGWVAGGLGSFSKEEQANLDAKIRELIQLEAKINRLKNPVQPDDSPLGPYVPEVPGSGTDEKQKTVFDAFKDYGKALEEIAQKEKLNLPGYDAAREHLNALTNAINQAVSASDAQTDSSQLILQQSARSANSMANEIAVRDEAARKAAEDAKLVEESWSAFVSEWQAQNAAFAAAIAGTAPPVYQFGDYLNQTAGLLENVQGPLKEFADSLVSTISQIQSIQGNLGNLSKDSFDKNSSGPLGELGGVLGALGAISGIMGAVMYMLSMLTGMDKAAENQQRAAEMWRKFLADASTSELFGKQDALQKQLDTLNKSRKELVKKISDSKFLGMDTPATTALRQMLKALDLQIDTIENKIGEEIPNRIKESLGIAISDLSGALKGAFSAASPDEFLTKFNQAFDDLIRNALITNFANAQLLAPLSDAIAAAFAPASSGGATITQNELNNLETMWAAIGEKGKGFFGVLDKLGLGMKDLTTSTNAAVEAMTNVPEGLKIERYRLAASSAVIVPNATVPTTITSPTQTTSGTGAATGGGIGQTIVRVYLNGRAITDDVKVWLERDNIIYNGSTVPATPQFAG
jgi:hypothetical protein